MMSQGSPRSRKVSGFEELPHAADWALRVWAESLPDLFCEAARGMNALSGIQLARRPKIRHTFTAEGLDAESLLVAFLSELVWMIEQENLAFDAFKIELRKSKLDVKMSGAPIISINKSIKAVTYHNLLIHKTDKGFELVIVFDV